MARNIRVDEFLIDRFELPRIPVVDGGMDVEFKILVRIRCRVSGIDSTTRFPLCGEIVPYAGYHLRRYKRSGGSFELKKPDTDTDCKKEKDDIPWLGGGMNGGSFLHLDFPCEIFYRQPFAYINRSNPGFADSEGNETDDVKTAKDAGEIRTALERYDIVLRDEPLFTVLPDDDYVKYEFQSAYLVRDPRPDRLLVNLGFRRHVTFIYGFRTNLKVTSARPENWACDSGRVAAT